MGKLRDIVIVGLSEAAVAGLATWAFHLAISNAVARDIGVIAVWLTAMVAGAILLWHRWLPTADSDASTRLLRIEQEVAKLARSLSVSERVLYEAWRVHVPDTKGTIIMFGTEDELSHTWDVLRAAYPTAISTLLASGGSPIYVEPRFRDDA